MQTLALALAATLLAGCSCGSNAGTVDAGTGDGTGGDGDGGIDPDADINLDADIDANPNVRGDVTVTIVDKLGGPLAGMHVVFIDTDQTITHVQTDSAGSATASVFPGASVTAVRARDTGGSYALTTVQSLVPGDAIRLISAASSATSTDDAFSVRQIPIDPTNAGTFTFTYPSYAGAQKYLVYTPCGMTDVATSTSPQLSFQQGCVRSPMDVVVVAATNAGAELAFLAKTGIAFTSGGSTTLSGPWTAPSSLTATYTNPTTRVTHIELERFAPYVRNQAPVTSTAMMVSGPTNMMVTATKPPSAVMKTRLTCPEAIGACISTPAGVALQTLAQVVDGTSATYSLDIGANLLPWVAATYIPQTTTIDITVTGSGTIDLFEANLRYVRGGAVIYTWRVFGAVPGDVTFPTLPNTVPGDPTVRSTDAQGLYQVFLCESDAIAGYRDAIDNVYEALGTCDMTANPLARPTMGGTFNRLSQWN